MAKEQDSKRYTSQPERNKTNVPNQLHADNPSNFLFHWSSLLCFPVSFSLSASRLSLSLSGVMKPIYILNYLSGECWGQAQVCYYNNRIKAGVDGLLTRPVESGEEEGGRGGGGWVGGRGVSVKDSAGLPALRRPFAVKHNFFCALLFVFPLIAKLFILINAVIQQVVRELPPLDSSSSLLH